MSSITERIRGAVARGWCHPENKKKEMDVELAIAISDEVEAEIREIRQEQSDIEFPTN